MAARLSSLDYSVQKHFQFRFTNKKGLRGSLTNHNHIFQIVHKLDGDDWCLIAQHFFLIIMHIIL